MGWEVWLADGSTMNSTEHKWEDVPDGILVVRWWNKEKRQKGIHWDDSYYGDPNTWKAGAFVDDEKFQAAMNEARFKPWPSDYTSYRP